MASSTSVIWKAEFPVTDLFTQDMPRGARILSVQVQGDQPCLWYLCDPAAPMEERLFRIAGTGHEPGLGVKDSLRRYVGTFQLYGGSFVGHVFEWTA